MLFGGTNGSALSNTWSWNGTTWSQLTPATSPPGRWSATMAYDPATGTVVLFGGYSGSSYLSDTWSWNGITWSHLTPATSPPARAGAMMDYDPTTGTMVLFGGSPGSGFLSDTWTWNGTTWSELTPADSSARTFERNDGLRPGHRTPWSSLAGTGSSGNLSKTPGPGTAPTGAKLTPAASPPARFRRIHGLRRGHSGIHVPCSAVSAPLALSSDTWTWDGTTWTQLTPAASPPSREYPSMAYDTATSNMVLFGGNNGSISLSDTWTFAPPVASLYVTKSGSGSVCGRSRNSAIGDH